MLRFAIRSVNNNNNRRNKNEEKISIAIKREVLWRGEKKKLIQKKIQFTLISAINARVILFLLMADACCPFSLIFILLLPFKKDKKNITTIVIEIYLIVSHRITFHINENEIPGFDPIWVFFFCCWDDKTQTYILRQNNLRIKVAFHSNFHHLSGFFNNTKILQFHLPDVKSVSKEKRREKKLKKVKKVHKSQKYKMMMRKRGMRFSLERRSL